MYKGKNNTTGVLLVALLAFCVACGEDQDPDLSQEIFGIWSHTSAIHEDPARSYKNEYIFNRDGTYESSLQIVETGGNGQIGYLSLRAGDFQVVENRLLLVQALLFGLDGENEFLDREELVSYEEVYEQEIRIEIKNGNNELVFNYPCGDHMSICLASMTLFKE